jgi:hypothetical protein
MKTKTLIAAVALAFTGLAHAQTVSQQQFHDELFCHDEGLNALQALSDYSNGVSIDAALQRTDNYLCSDAEPKVCDIKRGMLRDNTRRVYQLGAKLQSHGTERDQLGTFGDAVQTRTVAACLQVVRTGG